MLGPASAASCSLRVWRDLSAANTELNAVARVTILQSAALQSLLQRPNILVMRSLVTSQTTSVNSVLNTVSSDTPGDYKGAALEELRSLFRLYSYPADRRRGDLVQSRDFQYSVCPLIELRPLVLRLPEQEGLLLVPGPQELCVLPPRAQDDGL